MKKNISFDYDKKENVWKIKLGGETTTMRQEDIFALALFGAKE